MTLKLSVRAGSPRQVFVWLVLLITLAICGALVAGRGAETGLRARNAGTIVEGELVDVGGRALHVRCIGKGAPLVLLETGGAVPAVLNYPLQDRIARYTRTCAYDRAGLGLSDAATPGRDFEARAADAWTALERMEEAGPYLLVGSSFGGMLARKEAVLGSHRVVGLVLVDAAEEQFVFSHLDDLRRQLWQLRLLEYLAQAHLLGSLLKLTPVLDHLRPDYRQAAISQLSRPGHWRAALDEIAAYDATPPKDRRVGGLGSLGSTPLVVITRAEGDPRTAGASEWSQAQRRLLRLSSNARLSVAPNKGHNIASDDPDFVAAEVQRLVALARTRAAGSW